MGGLEVKKPPRTTDVGLLECLLQCNAHHLSKFHVNLIIQALFLSWAFDNYNNFFNNY